MITIKFCARYLSISISILGRRELMSSIDSNTSWNMYCIHWQEETGIKKWNMFCIHKKQDKDKAGIMHCIGIGYIKAPLFITLLLPDAGEGCCCCWSGVGFGWRAAGVVLGSSSWCCSSCCCFCRCCIYLIYLSRDYNIIII